MNKFLSFMREAVSCYHATKKMEEILAGEGYEGLVENQLWHLENGKKYYVKRNDSSIIAFTTPMTKTSYGINISASHSDSPSFKIKPNSLLKSEGYLRLNTEVYGGVILNTWLDKPLSVAGRVIVRENNTITTKLVYIDKDLLVIPNVAPHMDPKVGKGKEYNPQIDMMPLLACGDADLSIEGILAHEMQVKAEDIFDFDLILVNRQRARILGYNNDLVMSPQLDDLASAYTTLRGFLEAKNNDAFNVFVCFDNEEVGSRTRQGAGSKFLFDTLERVLTNLDYTEEEYKAILANSFLLSADNAHAVHPNLPGFTDQLNKTFINEGVVLKYNANQSYTTDSLSAAYIKMLAKDAEVKIQSFANRSDVRGGGTLGAISSSQVSIHAADIGLPQLAMHSSCEVCGIKDLDAMVRLCKNYFNHKLIIKNDNTIELIK